MERIGVIVALIFFGAVSAEACDVTPSQSVRIESIQDTVTYELTDGRTLRLEGLGPPRAPADHTGAWGFGEDARDMASQVIGDGTVEIAARPETDRYGRVIARVFLADGTWLGGELIRQGLARVETLPGQDRCATEGLALEVDARAAGQGMWRLSAYQVLSPEEAAAFTNDFQIVEGVIASTAEVRRRIYLNFGPDWREDFTVTLAPGDARRLRNEGFQPLAWAGQRIRVRGWLSWYNGPQIEVDHAAQIELLDTGPTFGGGEGENE